MHSSSVTLLHLFFCRWVKASRGPSQLFELVQLPHGTPESTRSLFLSQPPSCSWNQRRTLAYKHVIRSRQLSWLFNKAFKSSPKKKKPTTCLSALFIPEIKQACLKAKPQGFDKSSGYVDVRVPSGLKLQA